MSLKWDGNVPSAQIFLIDPAETKCTPDGQFIIAIPLLALTWKVVAAAAVAAFVGYELEHQFGHSHSDLGKAFGAAVGQMAKGSLGLVLNQAVY